MRVNGNGHGGGQPHHMELLRVSTSGSVDDGKSKLIVRLLYEMKGIFKYQLA